MPLPTAAELTDQTVTNTQMKDRLGQLVKNIDRSYSSLTEANADIANIEVGVTVTVNAENGGKYYKATADATSLTKSAYDPLTQAKLDATTKANNAESAAKSYTDNSLVNLNNFIEYYLNDGEKITKSGSYAFSNAFVMLESFSVATNSDHLGSINITTSDNVIYKNLTLKESDVFENNILKTYYSDIVDLAKLTPSISISSDATRALFYFNNAASNYDFAVNHYRVFDVDRLIASSAQASVPTDIKTVFGHSDGRIALSVPLSIVSAAGFAATIAGAQSWFMHEYGSKSLNIVYKTMTQKETVLSILGLVASDNLTITASNNVSFSMKYIENEVNSEDIKISDSRASAEMFSADVFNNTKYMYSNFPAELKVTFPQSVVNSQASLALKDENGITYKCHFVEGEYCNYRKNANIGKYSDGSFKTGSLFFNCDINTKTTKLFNLEVLNETKDAPINSVTKTDAGYAVSKGEFSYIFSTTSAYALTDIVYASIKKSCAVVQRVSILDSSVSETVYFTQNSTFDVVGESDVMTEIFVTATNDVTSGLSANSLKVEVTYRIFTSGIVQIRTKLRALTQIAAGVLRNYYSQIILGVAPYTSDTNMGAAYINSAFTPNSKNWSINQIISNGDIHRDGIAYGVSRPAKSTFLPNPTGPRSMQGWEISSDTESSFLQYVVEKDWVWTTETWINLNESQDSAANSVAAIHNRPVGFLAKSAFNNVSKKNALNTCLNLAYGFADFWLSNDSTIIGGNPSATSRLRPYNFELLKCINENGNFSECYSRFKAYVVAVHGTFTNLGNSYTSGRMILQFDNAMLVEPLEFFYKAAVKYGESTIIAEIKLAISSLAYAIVNQVNTTGGVPLISTSGGKGNGNSNAIGCRILALGIYANQDVDGKILEAFIKVEKLLTDPSNSGRYLPLSNDNITSTSPYSVDHYLLYETTINHHYALACKNIGREQSLDLSNHFLRALGGDGRPLDIDYCISESRRGDFSLAEQMISTFISSNRKSTLNALTESLKTYDLDFNFNYLATTRLYDYEPITSSWNASVKTATAYGFITSGFAGIWLYYYLS